MESDRRVSGIQIYRFTPSQELHASRPEFQALLRSIVYTCQKLDEEGSDRDVTTRSLSSQGSIRTVLFGLSGFRTFPDKDGKTTEIEPISEEVEIRLIQVVKESDEFIPSVTNKERDLGQHAVAMSEE
jgi:hypothetical protein